MKAQLEELTGGATLERGFLGVSVENTAGTGQVGVTVAKVDSISGRQPGETVAVSIERGGEAEQVEVILQVRAVAAVQ